MRREQIAWPFHPEISQFLALRRWKWWRRWKLELSRKERERELGLVLISLIFDFTAIISHIFGYSSQHSFVFSLLELSRIEMASEPTIQVYLSLSYILSLLCWSIFKGKWRMDSILISISWNFRSFIYLVSIHQDIY